MIKKKSKITYFYFGISYNIVAMYYLRRESFDFYNFEVDFEHLTPKEHHVFKMNSLF